MSVNTLICWVHFGSLYNCCTHWRFHGWYRYKYFLVKKMHFRFNDGNELVMPTEVFVEKLWPTSTCPHIHVHCIHTSIWRMDSFCPQSRHIKVRHSWNVDHIECTLRQQKSCFLIPVRSQTVILITQTVSCP